MLEHFALLSLAIGGAGALFLAALVVRRVWLERRERLRSKVEERLRPAALALLDGEEPRLPGLRAGEERVFAELLGRYARAVRGASRERIAAYFESIGGVERELDLLGSRQPWRRASAAFALGDMSSPRAVDGLVAALRDPEPEVRSAAARSLGRLGAVEAVEPLAETVVAGSVPRTLAGQALLEIGAAGLPSLLGLLTHDEADMRAEATELTGLLGGGAEAAAVLERLGDSSAAVRAAAAAALGRLGAAQVAQALRGRLDDRVPFVRSAAAAALGRLGDRAAVAQLVSQARDDEFEPAQAAADALARIDPALVARLAAERRAGPNLLEAADLLAV